MALQKLQFKPGVNRDQTNYTNEGGWFQCDKIRFRSGVPQKIGGWLKATATVLIGTCRQMFTWITSFGDNFMAVGTNKKLYIDAGANLYDITPLQRTSTNLGAAAGPFTATTGLATITVSYATDPTFLPTVGNYVTFSGATSLGGNITAAVLKIMQRPHNLNHQPLISVTGYGWGASVWGRGTWGSGSITPITVYQQDWFFDNFDNDLVANIRNGVPYYWTNDATFTTRAVPLSSITGASNVPAKVGQLLVSQGDKHLLAFGATAFGSTTFDPL